MSCPLRHCPAGHASAGCGRSPAAPARDADTLGGAVTGGTADAAGPPPIFREVLADLAGRPARAVARNDIDYRRGARHRFAHRPTRDDDSPTLSPAGDPWQRLQN